MRVYDKITRMFKVIKNIGQRGSSSLITRKLAPARAFVSIAAFFLLAVGCEDGDNTAGKDYGDNNGSLVVCIGDSLTMGYMCEGDSYPERLAMLTGKTVMNYGVGGVRSSHGVSIIYSVVARKPGYVCIMYGTNDAINVTEFDVYETIENLRRIVNVCLAYDCIPIIATIPPMSGSHNSFNGNVSLLVEGIREFAKEENICLVDIHKAFGDDTSYLNPLDGLHFSDAGGELVARKFAAMIP